MAVRSRRDDDFENSEIEENFERKPWYSKAMSEDEYHRLEIISPDRKYEYLYGKVYMMSGGRRGHDLIKRNIDNALDRKLEGNPCTVFSSDMQVLLGKKKNNRKHFVYPDVTVSCNPEDLPLDITLVKFPRLVVEVLSESTERRDRGIKFKAYQNCPTVQEIVLVNQFFPLVEVWQREQEQPDNPDTWQCRIYRVDQPVKLASLGLQLEMSEIYRNINFELSEDDEEDVEQAEE
jgi:Uma2 family endonuclease